jgi:hypothetical protein
MIENQDQNVEQVAKSKTQKLSAEKALPFAGADTLIKIIKGYVVASNAGESPVKYTDVASVTGLNQYTVSANNNFLVESQILTSPKYGYYVPSEESIRYAREAAWAEDKAKAHLRKLAARCWYGQIVIQNFALRSSLTRFELKKSLAIKAGATEGDAAALEKLIDFIIYTELILEDDAGTLTKGNLDEVEMPTPTPTRPVEQVHAVAPKVGDVYVQQNREAPVSVVLHLHFRNWNELTPENAVRLREWIEKVGMPNTKIETKMGTTIDEK